MTRCASLNIFLATAIIPNYYFISAKYPKIDKGYF